jgi:NAD(P)-dependent dehydrogenase (short-subunit alcohol dehydrogenase family)
LLLKPGTEGEAQRAVLVTGASTGFGRKITEHLAASGVYVYAGVRKDCDVAALGAINNVHPIRLDVTNPQHIAAAVESVTNANRGLYGLVNNAGVLTLGPVVGGKDEEFELVMSVNVGGPYRMTKAFASLIIAEKGRIITIGSAAGIGTVAIKDVGVYSMSKHAIEALTDALAIELEPFGVRVSVVEPGGYNTEIYKKTIERIGADHLTLDISEYRAPHDVVAAVALALFEPQPKRRYLVVSTEAAAQRTIMKQMVQLAQVNEDHAYTYDRTELIRMLDSALVQSRPAAAC